MTRVLLVSHYYPPHVGGIENVVRHEALHLTRAGAEVTVLTSGPRTVTEEDEGVRVVRVAAWNGVEERTGVPFPVLSPRVLAAAVRWARWADVVHVHDCLYMTSWAAGLGSALTGTPQVMTQHVALVEHPSVVVRAVQRAVYGLAGRLLLRRARRVLVVNGRVADFVTAHGARAVDHLANGVDTHLFRPPRSAEERRSARREFGLPKDRVLVLFVGRLVPKKGYDLLVGAADAGYDLVFAGDGAQETADAPGVHHLGALAPDRLAGLYRAVDLFALPSVAEGFPLTVQEAMASGLPVVTTDDPGYAPYRLADAGVRLLPRDGGRLRGTLRELAGDEELRAAMGRSAHARAATDFAWEQHTAALLRTYAAAVVRRMPKAPA
ncbi:glycosyltransferase family 4 protein [Streptomyces sp. NPDC090108]|uniref:glycosyltransferase family 4 protein n=1 Tax=Streptomyces sp. NPDC090108 TaxID=3365947 RepID=UPI00380EB2CC